VPGFPTFTLIFIGGALGVLAYLVQKKQTKEKEMEKITKEDIETGPKKPADYVEHVKIDPLEIELGYSLTPLVTPKTGGTLLDQISNLREKFAMEMGLIVPPIRIRDNMSLAPEVYVIKVMGIQVGTGEIQVGKLMAMDTGKVTEEIEGIKFTEPTYKKPAIWIEVEKRQEAEMKGYSVVAPETILITHLTETINSHASELLGRQQVQLILDSLREDYSAVLSELDNASPPVTTGEIQKILQNLVKEGVSIRNMVTILETFANNLHTRNADIITEQVRQALARQIVMDYLNENNELLAITLQPELERILRSGLSARDAGGRVIAMSPHRQKEIKDALTKAVEVSLTQNRFPIFLTTNDLRLALFTLLERLFNTNKFAVLSHDEVPGDITVIQVGEAIIERKEEEPVEF